MAEKNARAAKAAKTTKKTDKRAPASAAIAAFQKGVEAMNKKSWNDAKKAFETAMAESGDHVEVKDRAHLMIQAIERVAASSVAADDPFTQAVWEFNRGNLDAALDVVKGELKKKGDPAAFNHLAAAILAKRGKPTDAIEHLTKAVEADPKLVPRLRMDPDFDALRGQAGFQAIVASSSKKSKAAAAKRR